MSQLPTAKREQDSRASSKRARSSRRRKHQRKTGARSLRLEGLENRSMLSVSACILVSGEGETPIWHDSVLEQDAASLVAAEQVAVVDAVEVENTDAPADRVEPVADDPVRDDVSLGEEAARPLPQDSIFAMSDEQQLGGSVLRGDAMPEGQQAVTALVEGPQHGTLVLGENGLFTYTPDRGFSGTVTFAYRVAGSQDELAAAAQTETAQTETAGDETAGDETALDGTAGDGAEDGTANDVFGTVTIVVEASNASPLAADDSYTVDEDERLVVDVQGLLENDTDADGDSLTAVLVGAPAHGTVMLTGDGTFEYTPNADFYGSDSFTYAANDGSVDSNLATVSIEVEPVNDAPVAVEDGYTTREGEALVVDAPGVLANDSDDEDDSLTAALVDEPLHGTVILAEDGSFEYTPDADFNGTDRFTYVANDGLEDSQPAVVEITVTPIDLTIQLQVAEQSFATETETAWAGATFWVNAYVQDLRDLPAGVVGGAIDILFDSQMVAPTGAVVYGEAFDLFQQGVVDAENGQIDEAGAISTAIGVGVDALAPFVAWEFVSLAQPSEGTAGAHLQFVVEFGEGTETVMPADFALIGSGQPVAAEQIALKNAEVDLYFADLNVDGAVDHFDLALWQPHAGTAEESPGYDPMCDLNADRAIDALDLDLLTAVMYRPTTWGAADADADAGDSSSADALEADLQRQDPSDLEPTWDVV